jgi:wyosine [tRNA(Phe)-imidazoG37] synthetase (radical SAM superfamily)
MISAPLITPDVKLRKPFRRSLAAETAFGCPRDFLTNRFVYLVLSPRARGLSVGVNMNPDKHCNFDCAYCEVDRSTPGGEPRLDVAAMSEELRQTLALMHSGQLRQQPGYNALPDELLELRHVALSGDGEPTRCPNFAEAVQTVVHVRARGWSPFFPVVLITNATGLDRPEVQAGLRLFTDRDEVWAKLDGGTQAHLNRVNRPDCRIEDILEKILLLGRQRPVVIQSLFPSLNGTGPSADEIAQYARRLLELKNQGAQISLVQIYSATRPTPHSGCGHLPLKTLSDIARTVRELTGLRVEVF